MSPGRTATSVPKRTLVDTILRVISEDSIRARLRIAANTPLRQRLQDFTKAELLALLTSTPRGEQALAEVECNYPLFSPPTLYLVKVQRRPDTDVLLRQTTALADLGWHGGVKFGEDRAVRIVYVANPAYTLELNKGTIEIPLLYERRFEYTVCEPGSDDYGERKALYSLERAFIWLIDRYSHAIICCSDFVAVRPIIDFAKQRLELRWALPDLTEDMLNRLAADGNPRSATFFIPSAELATVLDVRTITISDPHLGERDGFRQISQDPNRQQTAGFYSNHPDLVFGGLGIARRYGRIWTPAHLSRRSLVALAVGLIRKTEEELSRAYDRNLVGYVHYFGNIAVTIKGHQLRGKERQAFSQLVVAILRAAEEDSAETTIGRELLHTLVAHQKQLCLTITAEFDCPECGIVLGQCPDCHLPYVVKMSGDTLLLECPNPKCRRRLKLYGGFECECGQVVPVAAFENHLRMFPGPELLDGLREFLEAMDDVTWEGLFFISGYTLRLLPLPSPPARQIISLGDLRLWRVRAQYHVRHEPGGPRRKALIRILKSTKEKCRQNNGHPTHEICARCLAGPISVEQVKTGEICLPRILGLAIAEGFDGVHHGYEVADVKYEDVFDDTGDPVRLGVHLKSRTRSRPKGLGRGARPVKGLYTQLFYSAYLALTGRAEFDVIGISVPNTIHKEVVASMQHLVNELGFSFLVLDECDWLKIADAVLEQLEVEQSPESQDVQV